MPNGLQTLSNSALVAASDLTANRFYAVKVGTGGTVALAGAGSSVFGILTNKPDTGEACAVDTHGISCALLGGSVTRGDALVPDATGRLVTASSPELGVATALETGTVGQMISVAMSPAGAPGTASDTFCLSFYIGGTVPESAATLMNNIELPHDFTVLMGFASCLTAPGSAETCTITITDGTSPQSWIIDGTATVGEDKAINQAYAAAANLQVTAVNSAGGATANLNVLLVCQRT
jgi:hypothetical protein